MSITAKVKLTKVEPQQFNGSDSVRLEFYPDYQDGRNAEWAVATPHLNLSMTVKSDVAKSFSLGGAYTLTFDEEVTDGDSTG